MDRQFLLEKSKRRASGDTMLKGETGKTKTLWTEFDEEKYKHHLKMKKKEELSTLRKELKASRRNEEVLMHDLDRVQKTNKELVAKLEEVEIDKKIMVDNRIQLMKILDEETKKVSCLEKKCVNLEKSIESHKKAYKSKILEEAEEKLEAEKEKNRALEEEVDKYKRLIEENDLIACRKEGSGFKSIKNLESSENKERKEVLKADEKWEKVEVEREEMKELIASVEERLEKAGGMEADGLKNKVESHKLVDGNTDDEFEDTMFGNEDDTVYVDFDGFQVVGTF